MARATQPADRPKHDRGVPGLFLMEPCRDPPCAPPFGLPGDCGDLGLGRGPHALCTGPERFGPAKQEFDRERESMALTNGRGRGKRLNNPRQACKVQSEQGSTNHNRSTGDAETQPRTENGQTGRTEVALLGRAGGYDLHLRAVLLQFRCRQGNMSESGSSEQEALYRNDRMG